MFLREHVKKVNGKVYRYLSIVEGYRDAEGKVKQRVIVRLGRADRLNVEVLKKWTCALSKVTKEIFVSPDQIVPEKVWDYGDVVALFELSERLKISNIITSCTGRKLSGKSIGKLTTLMTINRCIEPQSKRALPKWYKQTALSVFNGVKHEDLYPQLLYRCMDELIKKKTQIEQALVKRLQELFDINVDTVFYDITSSYFEGNGCESANYGFSREHRNDKKQITWGLVVTKKGFPLMHEMFNGNTADKTTVPLISQKLKEEFGIRRVIFVIDRGMMCENNLDFLIEQKYQYIVAQVMRNVRELVWEALEKVPTESFEPIDKNLAAIEIIKKESGKDIKYIIVHNKEKVEADKAFREKQIECGKSIIEKVRESVRNGHIKNHDKILKRLIKNLARKDLDKYFEFDIPPSPVSDFSYKINNNLDKLDGKWVLKTNVFDLSKEEIVAAYKNLAIVEQAFKVIKGFLQVRPIRHYKDRRVRAHLFICVLSYLLEKVIEHYLKKAGLSISPQDAIDVLHNIKLVEIKIGEQFPWTVRRISKLDSEQKRILDAMEVVLRKNWLS